MAFRWSQVLSLNPDLQHKTMSVAEKLKAEGHKEGHKEGLKKGLIGKIHLLEEFLDLPITPSDSLEALDLEQIESRCQELHREYEARFKGN